MQTIKGHMPKPEGGEISPVDSSVVPGFPAEISDRSETRTPTYRARALATPGWNCNLGAEQHALDTARARSFVYRFLTKAFASPKPKNWEWLSNPTIHTILCSAVRHLSPEANSPLRKAATELIAHLHPGEFETSLNEHTTLFLWAERDSKRVSPANISDLSDFLHAFGLELTSKTAEGSEKLCTALEFMFWLTTQEGDVLEQQRVSKDSSFYIHGQSKFIREYISNYIPHLCRDTKKLLGSGVMVLLTDFTQAFVETESERFAEQVTRKHSVRQAAFDSPPM